MVLQWEINNEKYHFYNKFQMTTPLVCIDLMQNKKTNIVENNSVSIEETVLTSFPDVNGLGLQEAKALIIEHTLAYFDYLTLDDRNSHLDKSELCKNFNNLNETFIDLLTKQHGIISKEPLEDMKKLENLRLRLIENKSKM